MDKDETVAAGVFKQRCLAILDDVARDRVEIVITKRGKPVAKLVPIESSQQQEEMVLRRLRNLGQMLVPEEEFLQPTMDDAGWGADVADSSDS